LVDVDRLEALLIEAARARRSLTYAEMLAHFGIRITPRPLAVRRNRAARRNEPAARCRACGCRPEPCARRHRAG
jgi:hypothetical protein